MVQSARVTRTGTNPQARPRSPAYPREPMVWPGAIAPSFAKCVRFAPVKIKFRPSGRYKTGPRPRFSLEN